MIDPQLLAILCCPETHQNVVLADAGLIDALNRRAASGNLVNRTGKPVKDKLDGGLIRADKKFLYPIQNKIPVMLIEEAIPLP